MPVAHYENFPVASWLVPAGLRAPIEAIYGFARAADDVADEGDATEAERLAGLDGFLRALDEIEAGRAPRGADLRAPRRRGTATSSCPSRCCAT